MGSGPAVRTEAVRCCPSRVEDEGRARVDRARSGRDRGGSSAPTSNPGGGDRRGSRRREDPGEGVDPRDPSAIEAPVTSG